MKLDPQVTGNAALYYCCYRLTLLGWSVMPTSRNARGVDILAYDGNATRFIGIQVKNLGKRAPVPVGTSLDNILGDFWVIVSDLAKKPKSFVLLPSEVRERAQRGEHGARASYWLQPTQYDDEKFREKWERIGAG